MELLFGIIIVAVGLGIAVIFLSKRSKLSKKDIKYVESSWRKIKEMDPQKSVLEADKLLDFILSKMGYKGSLGEKLKASGALFSDINGVWRAHKKRNILAHELEANVSKKEAITLLDIFRKAFSDLGIKV